jgi:hypothetical protein
MDCRRQIRGEPLAITQPKALHALRLHDTQQQIDLVMGGKPGRP